MNLIGVSPLMGLGIRPFMVGQIALKYASNKVVKKACSDYHQSPFQNPKNENGNK